jgi:hypothetical protein
MLLDPRERGAAAMQATPIPASGLVFAILTFALCVAYAIANAT